MSAVTAPVFPVEVIRLELTAAGAASFAVHYKHLQQLLCTRQVEQQWQHQYNQFLTLKGSEQQQFQQQLQTLRLQQQHKRNSDEQQQQPQQQQQSSAQPPPISYARQVLSRLVSKH
jgi:hypothetical protein